MTDDDELLTPAQVATRLGVTRQSAYKWVTDGKLGAIRVEGQLRVPAHEVAAFIARRQQPRRKPLTAEQHARVKRLADALLDQARWDEEATLGLASGPRPEVPPDLRRLTVAEGRELVEVLAARNRVLEALEDGRLRFGNREPLQ